MAGALSYFNAGINDRIQVEENARIARQNREKELRDNQDYKNFGAQESFNRGEKTRLATDEFTIKKDNYLTALKLEEEANANRLKALAAGGFAETGADVGRLQMRQKLFGIEQGNQAVDFGYNDLRTNKTLNPYQQIAKAPPNLYQIDPQAFVELHNTNADAANQIAFDPATGNYSNAQGQVLSAGELAFKNTQVLELEKIKIQQEAKNIAGVQAQNIATTKANAIVQAAQIRGAAKGTGRTGEMTATQYFSNKQSIIEMDATPEQKAALLQQLDSVFLQAIDAGEATPSATTPSATTLLSVPNINYINNAAKNTASATTMFSTPTVPATSSTEQPLTTFGIRQDAAIAARKLADAEQTLSQIKNTLSDLEYEEAIGYVNLLRLNVIDTQKLVDNTPTRLQEFSRAVLPAISSAIPLPLAAPVRATQAAVSAFKNSQPATAQEKIDQINKQRESIGLPPI